MLIAGIFTQKISAGGGYHQGLNALLQMQSLCRGRHEFVVFTTVPANVPVLSHAGLPTKVFKGSLWDSVFTFFQSFGVFPFVQSRTRWLSSFERRLLREGVDLVYFVYPSFRATLLQRLNFIFTVWDLCHRDFPEFPEVREFGAIEIRETMYRCALPKAFLTLTDSPELKERLVQRYGVDHDRVLAMPFQPSVALAEAVDDQAALSTYQLPSDYLFYPAQFWSHKGHRRILQALALLRQRYGDCPYCAFAGGGAGREAIECKAVESGLKDRVFFLGFVPSEHLGPLYRRARALVMPTYFGPTNLPPLEAWSLDVPVIYPAHLRAHAGDAAIYFDVDSAESLARAIEESASLDRRAQLATAGREQVRALTNSRREAEAELSRRLDSFAARRELWA